MSVWKKIDKSHNLDFIREDDQCIYAREYKAWQGYKGGETNQLIFNFKKEPSKKETEQWKYRERDVRRFAQEIASIFDLNFSCAITAIPSSKTRDDPMYSNRFEDAFQHLTTLRPRLVVEWPIDVKVSVQPAHDGGSRKPAEIMENFIWSGFQNGSPEVLVVCDDVVTTGSHFRAVSNFLQENGFYGRIVGVFWARSVFPSAQDIFEKIPSDL